MIDFPAIVPSGRDFTCPKFRVRIGKLINIGDGILQYPREVSGKGFDATLRLSFEKRPDANAAAVLTAWLSSISGFFPLNLPEETVGGIEDTDLAVKMRLAEHLDWHFAQRPALQAVVPGITTVSVELIALMP